MTKSYQHFWLWIIAENSLYFYKNSITQYTAHWKNRSLHTYIYIYTHFTFGVMLCVMQNCRCVRMLSMLWKPCCRVVRRYFCMARAIGAKMAWAASRGSMTSRGCLGDEASSSSWRRLMCVKASSTATTNLCTGKSTAWKVSDKALLNATWVGFLFITVVRKNIC